MFHTHQHPLHAQHGGPHRTHTRRGDGLFDAETPRVGRATAEPDEPDLYARCLRLLDAPTRRPSR